MVSTLMGHLQSMSTTIPLRTLKQKKGGIFIWRQKLGIKGNVCRCWFKFINYLGNFFEELVPYMLVLTAMLLAPNYKTLQNDSGIHKIEFILMYLHAINYLKLSRAKQMLRFPNFYSCIPMSHCFTGIRYSWEKCW